MTSQSRKTGNLSHVRRPPSAVRRPGVPEVNLRRPARPARPALALSVSLAALALVSPAAAGAANGVGPGQAFAGRVNGSFSDATVKVVCPGPASLGRRGHPISGQDLEVLSPLPPVAAGIKISVGQTGTAGRAIVARFTDDPSVATAFHQYFVNKPIATSMMLPCSGIGKVVFRPTPTSPSARSSVVSVTYVNIAA
ncbi:MAG: hypothetical protein M3083_25060 [Actinomycetota bacterium]|nr:hypothetical protein [Actinomycetota bacterium]MDQ6948486.1 hypothetical protein [Actinomycetota bacterium]